MIRIFILATVICCSISFAAGGQDGNLTTKKVVQPISPNGKSDGGADGNFSGADTN